jgi:cell division septation protein DedD
MSMSDSTRPIPNIDQPNSESFNRGLLSDSDTEFLAELDRVLAAETIAGSEAKGEDEFHGDYGVQDTPISVRLTTPASVKASDSWSSAALLLALIGVAAGGAGIWQVNLLDNRLSHLEDSGHALTLSTLDSTEANKGLRLETLQQKIDRIASGLEHLHDDLPDKVARMQGQQGPEIAAIKAELARLATQIKGMQEASARPLPQREPPPSTNSPHTAIIKDLKSELGAARAQIKALQDSRVEDNKRLTGAEHQLAQLSAAVTTKARSQTPVPASKVARAPRANSGSWSVNLLSFRRKETAEKELARLGAEQQIRGQVAAVTHGGQTWYRVEVAGFSDFDSAKAYADEVRAKPGLSSAWIGRD